MFHRLFKISRLLASITQKRGPTPSLTNHLPGPAGSANQLAVDQILGDRYRLRQVIGRGGSSTVYEALDLQLDHSVAVKVASANRAHSNDDTPGSCNGLRNEALTAMRLSHPLIVRVHDYGQQWPWEYLVMEVVNGTNLHALLRSRHGGRLRPEETILIGLDVLEALSFAHRQAVMHNDITPKNILMDENGEVKVCDFGASERLQYAEGRPAETVAGTILFVSPERISGLPTDPRSDIYSLGVTLYSVCSGRVPFHLQTIGLRSRKSLQTKTARGKVRPSPHVPPRLHAILEKAMELDPNKRFTNADEMRAALIGLIARNRCPPSWSNRNGVEGREVGQPEFPSSAAQSLPHSSENGECSEAVTAGLLTLSTAEAERSSRFFLQRSGKTLHSQLSNSHLNLTAGKIESIEPTTAGQTEHRSAPLSTLLESILGSSPDIEGIALVSEDRLIACRLSSELSQTRFAQIGGLMLSLGKTAAHNLTSGSNQEIILRWDGGYAIAISVKTATQLLIVSNEKAKLGILLYNLTNTIDKLHRIL
ncbi:MAG: protein kinase [Gammaproteobacteria bacterium]